MNDLTPFEKEIKQTYRLPDANPAFFNRLEARLQVYQSHPEAKAKPTFHFTRGWAAHRWVYAMATILLIGVMVLVIGPSKVLAQIQAVLGFVPDVGLVDTSSPFRQLAEPVSDTKDGITLTVHTAFLSADQTIITYTISDLPAEMEHARFGDPECSTPAYLALPDGSKVEASGSSGGLASDGSFVHRIRFDSPFPADFNRTMLVFSCLEGTAQGKGPENWQIALAFKPAPEDIAVYPATLMPPQAKPKNPVPAATDLSTQPEAETNVPDMRAMIVDGNRQEDMVVLSVVEQPEAYWVTWAYPDRFDDDIQINGRLYEVPFNPVLYDANGVELPVPDLETQIKLWNYEESLRSQLSSDEDGLKYIGSMHTFLVPKAGVAFPVYAKQNVYERSFPEKEAFAEIEFDGTKVQTSDRPVEINQEIQLGSVKFKLEDIEKNQFGGYSFLFDGTDGRVVQCLVDLIGYSTNMGGNSFNPDDPFRFYQARMYSQIPTGKLTVRVSQPAVLGDLISFIGSWSPEN